MPPLPVASPRATRSAPLAKVRARDRRAGLWLWVFEQAESSTLGDYLAAALDGELDEDRGDVVLDGARRCPWSTAMNAIRPQ
jgi:hypothetical protein